MGSTVKMLLWVWVVLDLGVCSVSLPEISDKKFIDECVREHNRARSSVSPPASDMLYMVSEDGVLISLLVLTSTDEWPLQQSVYRKRSLNSFVIF